MNAHKATSEALAVAAEVKAVADGISQTPARVALNWLRQREQQVIPIVGARTASQLQDSLGALTFRLDDKNMERLDNISAVDLGFPHSFLSNGFIQTLIHGKKYSPLEPRT
jgi:aryl-alcohol dehydrogenase-like predicted oxidoreductase